MKTEVTRVSPDERSAGPAETYKGSVALLNKNLPDGSFREIDALDKISKFAKRKRLRKLSDLCRWKKLQRVIIRGEPWYVPVGDPRD